VARTTQRGRTVVGVDVGGTKCAAALVGPDGALSAVHRVPTPADGEELVAAVVDLVAAVSRGARTRPAALGVGVAALIDADGRVAMSTHLDIAGRELVRELAAKTGLPAVADNDGNTAALAEARLGAARGHATSMMLTLGTGIGGGIVVDGMPFRGGNGMGAELGHVVVDADGPPCQGACPNRGCVETMASGTAVAREAGAAALADPSGRLAAERDASGTISAEAVARLAAQGDAPSRSILERAGRYLGVAIASLANVLGPGIVVVGGGMGAVGDLVLEPAREEYRARALGPDAQAAVVAAELGWHAGILGAAILAREAPG
jgi:glucokinase